MDEPPINSLLVTDVSSQASIPERSHHGNDTVFLAGRAFCNSSRRCLRSTIPRELLTCAGSSPSSWPIRRRWPPSATETTNAFRLPVQDFVRHDSDECAAHEGTALARTDELFPRDRIHEFQQVAIQIGIALLVGRFGWQSRARQLPSQGIQRGHIFLKAWQRTE